MDERENSPEPGTPQTGYKAYVATGLSFLATFGGFWIADTDPFTSKEVVQGLITAGVSSGIIGAATFTVKNRAK
jgi:hypothetical protein